jgi:hypothetical protein
MMGVPNNQIKGSMWQVDTEALPSIEVLRVALLDLSEDVPLVLDKVARDSAIDEAFDVLEAK